MKALSQLLFDTRPVAKRRRRGGCDIPTSAVHLEFLMHRVSSVWKESPRKEEGALGGGAITNWQQNLAKGNNNHHSNSKNDLQLLRYSWERSHKVWPAITMFLFVFTVCLIMIPELLDSVSLEARRSADLVAGSVQPGEQDSVRLMISELSRSSVLDVAPEITHGAVRGVQGLAGTGLQDDVQKDILLPPSGADLNPLQLSAAIQIYVYELPRKFNEDWLVDKRCSNHLFAAEVAIHRNLLSSPLRTLNPDEADFFFLPVYVSCKFSPKTGFPSIGHAPRTIHSAVSLVSSAMPYWNRSKGSDHIFVATHDFGACFHSMEDMAMEQGIPGFMRNSIILQTFGETTWHPCQDVENIQIPPYISPLDIAPYMLPPEEQKRNIFAFFRGKMEIHPKNYSGRMYSRGVRTAIYHRYGRNKLFYLKRQRAEGYQAELLRSIFCLCPLGWAPWSPRIVESVVFGCVPVIIADNIALPYSHAVDWNAISLKVREIDVPRLAKILLHVAATNLSVIQKNLWKEENRQALLFLEPLRIGDATWHLLDLLSRKIGRSHATRSPRALLNTEI
ncbi:unnamed protein product [Sphagnum troendelagicum]|uniref:Exostosin GT47 domain-containing protein n=1 Tax=Sphagnum troendelagicum TaxID=128251 RepID=A0ABP0TX16_9BRYO